jgi:hypothetical protein
MTKRSDISTWPEREAKQEAPRERVHTHLPLQILRVQHLLLGGECGAGCSLHALWPGRQAAWTPHENRKHPRRAAQRPARIGRGNWRICGDVFLFPLGNNRRSCACDYRLAAVECPILWELRDEGEIAESRPVPEVSREVRFGVSLQTGGHRPPLQASGPTRCWPASQPACRCGL